MTDEFQVLKVVFEDSLVRATLTSEKLTDDELRKRLERDLELLALKGSVPVTLDMRSAKFMDGTIPGRLMKLSDSISAAGGALTVLAAANICEVLRLLHLDKKFRVAESDEPPGLFKLSAKENH